MTGALLAPALAAHNGAAIAPTAARLLEELDIVRVEVRDSRGTVLFNGENPQDAGTPPDSAAQIGPATLEPLVFTSSIPPVTTAQGPRGGGTLKIWVSRAKMQETLAGLHAQLEHQKGSQIRRMQGFLARVTLPLVAFASSHDRSRPSFARPIASAKAITPARCTLRGATRSASCSSHSSACGRSSQKPPSPRITSTRY
jgi:hypothetical protein